MKKIMIKTILCAVMALTTLNAHAQVKAFEKYADMNGITYVYISKAMLSAISGRLNNMPSMPNVNAQALVNKLSCIQLIHAEKNNMRTKLKSEVKGIVKKDKYELLMQVKEDSNKADIYQNVGPQQSAVVMLVEENDGVTAVVFSGKFTKIQTMNKIVLITGATSGIGLACARKFAENGDKLILTGRNEQRLTEICQELTGKGSKVLTLVFDVRDREKVKQCLDTLPADWQDIDVLVNNAGLALGLEPEYEGCFDDWDTMIDTNIKGLLTLTRLIVPKMVQRNSGHVINVGSVAGDAAYAGGNVYCATKAAVKALSDGLRIDVAPTAVRVTNLKPGLVETNFSNTRFHGDNDRAANVYKGIKPLTGDDIADVAVYAANAPAHVQIAEVLILATHQASGSVIVRK